MTWCDNMGASALASNFVYHARTKHIELNDHFVRDKVQAKELNVRYISYHDQVADFFDKELINFKILFSCRQTKCGEYHT